MKIKAVFFDMGGTIDTFGYTPELRLARTPGIQDLLLKAGIDLGLSTQELYEVVSEGLLRYKKWSLLSEQEIPSAQVLSDYILPAFSVDHERLAAVSEELMCYIETRYFDRKVRPEIPAVLEQIRERGYQIGLISNVNSKGQVPTNLQEYRIKDYFDPIVLSSEYGQRKPDPSIFHHAASLAEAPTSQCLHVGDRITRDILGAQRAGFGLTVQIKHIYNHHETETGAAPDFVIEQMTELLDILDSNQESTSPQSLSDHDSPGPFKALIFDAGDILYHRIEKERYFKEFLTGLDIDLQPDRKQELEDLRLQAFQGEILQEEYQIALLRRYGIDQPEYLIRGLEALKKDEDQVQFFKGVRETLITLKERGFLLGILTDTANSVHTKLGWFEKGGIGHLWDSFTSSMVVGTRKPDPKMYQAALNQLGVLATEALFIGHKASELEGARTLGLMTIAFNRDEDAEADFIVDQFADILEVPLITIKKETLRGN
jgi:putative hydrolase of the HAD superfamily